VPEKGEFFFQLALVDCDSVVLVLVESVRSEAGTAMCADTHRDDIPVVNGEFLCAYAVRGTAVGARHAGFLQWCGNDLGVFSLAVAVLTGSSGDFRRKCSGARTVFH